MSSISASARVTTSRSDHRSASAGACPNTCCASFTTLAPNAASYSAAHRASCPSRVSAPNTFDALVRFDARSASSARSWLFGSRPVSARNSATSFSNAGPIAAVRLENRFVASASTPATCRDVPSTLHVHRTPASRHT